MTDIWTARLGPDELAELSPREQASYRRRRFLLNMNLPQRMLGVFTAQLSNIPQPTLDASREWLSDVLNGVHHKGLLLRGAPGIGKTSLACSLAQEWVLGATADQLGQDGLNSGYNCTWPAYYLTMAGFMRLRGRCYSDDHEESTAAQHQLSCMLGEATPSAANIRLLVIDDLGKEHKTAKRWAEDTVDEVLRARYDAGLPTIVTTNIGAGARNDEERNWEWITAYEESMASFVHEAFVLVQDWLDYDLRKGRGEP